MSNCKIDHTVEDVNNKLNEQENFLPTELFEGSRQFLKGKPEQEKLNSLFHLLKKYDLASNEVKAERNGNLKLLIFG